MIEEPRAGGGRTPRLPSIVYCLMAEDAEPPDPGDIFERLVAGDRWQVLEVGVADQPTYGDAEWQARALLQLADLDEPVEHEFWLHPNPAREVLQHTDRLSGEESRRALLSRWALGVSVRLQGPPLEAFRRQLAVAAAAVPDMEAVLDSLPMEMHSGDWVRDAAAASAPPSPPALFVIHAVGEDRDRAQVRWLHTHGLMRCGPMELEILDVPEADVGAMGLFLNAVATLSLYDRLPAEGEVFRAGDGLDLLWLSSQKALKHVRAGILGTGPADRDSVHSMASGVLFAPPRGLLSRRLRSPACYGPLLGENPLLLVPTEETDRMVRLAWERWPRFAAVHHRHAAEEGWTFLVKLGMPTKDAAEAEEREHLWFEIHAIQGDEVEATLVNEPCYVRGLREGQRGLFPLNRLTDWTIMCEYGRFEPDTILQLEHDLEGTD